MGKGGLTAVDALFKIRALLETEGILGKGRLIGKHSFQSQRLMERRPLYIARRALN